MGESLPKVSYLTLLDKCMLTAFAFVFLSGAESFLVFVLDKHGAVDAAAAIDYWMSVLMPVFYLAINVMLTFRGFRYRWLIMNDKDSEAYVFTPFLACNAPCLLFSVLALNSRAFPFFPFLLQIQGKCRA